MFRQLVEPDNYDLVDDDFTRDIDVDEDLGLSQQHCFNVPVVYRSNIIKYITLEYICIYYI